jgi:hypothetical protein
MIPSPLAEAHGSSLAAVDRPRRNPAETLVRQTTTTDAGSVGPEVSAPGRRCSADVAGVQRETRNPEVKAPERAAA